MKYYSTEATLLCLPNGIRLVMKSKNGAIVIMIDLSSAFDIIDHSILLSILNLGYDITSVPLEWFRSYPCGKSLRVNIDESFFLLLPINYRGSSGINTWSPVVFSLCIVCGGSTREYGMQCL